MEYVKGDSIGDTPANNLNEVEYYINICVNEQKDSCYTCEYR